MGDKLIVFVLVVGAFVGGAFGLFAALPDEFYTFHMHTRGLTSDANREAVGISLGAGSGLVAAVLWLLAMWRVGRNADSRTIVLGGMALGCGAGALAGMLMQLGLSVVTHSSLAGPLLVGLLFGAAGGFAAGAVSVVALCRQRVE
jgi:hypothetical protein